MVSSTAVMESQFTEQFKGFIKNESDTKLRRLREEAYALFRDSGFPTVKNEDWKYTNVAPIAKEEWRAEFCPSVLADLDKSSLELLSCFNIRRSGFASLNLAFGEFQIVRIT